MDTFGFGVILLELISGMSSYDPRRTPKGLNTFMEKDMDTANPAILCTKVDKHAGDWPSTSFAQLFVIAKKCVEAKLDPRPEIADIFPDLEELMAQSIPGSMPIKSSINKKENKPQKLIKHCMHFESFLCTVRYVYSMLNTEYILNCFFALCDMYTVCLTLNIF